MSEYRILTPVVYAHDGVVTQHKQAGAIVEISDDVACELSEAVQLIDRPDVEPETAAGTPPTGAPAMLVDPVVTPDDPTVTPEPTPETESDVPPVTDPESTSVVVPEADEVAKPRRSRGRTEGSDG